MAASHPAPAPGPAARESPRVALAALALRAALAHPAVAGADPGPRGIYVTAATGGARVAGARVIAQGPASYELGLSLITAPVPLRELATEIRARVRRSAEAAGSAPRLGAIQVHIADLDDGAGFPTGSRTS